MPKDSPARSSRLDPCLPGAVLVDMDGCLIHGPNAAPGAGDLLARAGRRLFVVTNNSTHSPAGIGRLLALRGLRVPAARIVAAGAVAVETLRRERPEARILLCGTPALAGMARRAGLRLVSAQEETADVVLLGRDLGFTARKLGAVVRAIEDGATLWVTNPDLTHPVERGRRVFETGALLAAVTACVGEVPMRVIGKPAPDIFRAALARAGCTPDAAVMIGDNPATDVAGARAIGLPALLVGPHAQADAPDIAGLLA